MRNSLVTYGRGLFQGDALSCILFQLSILPISNALAKCERFKGPRIDGFSNHLLFMDDLKVYSNSREGLEYMLKVVASSSEAIGMELGLAKCAQAHIVRGTRVTESESMSGVRPLELTETYKYLGVRQSVGHNDTKGSIDDVVRVITEKATRLCQSKLNGKNIVNAWNSEIVGALGYYFSCLSCTRSYVQRTLEPMFKKIMARYLLYYRVDSVDRLFIPCLLYTSPSPRDA